MIVGFDYRPALMQCAGIARYGRQLAGALANALGPQDELRLFGHSWAPARVPESLWRLESPGVRVFRRRIPGRAVLLAGRALGRGVDDWIGGCDVFHRTDFVNLPVRRARIVSTVFDASFVADRSFHEPEVAANLSRIAGGLIAESRVVLAPSEFAAAELVLRLGAPIDQVVVTPLGMDHFPHLPTTALPPHPRPYVISLGTVEPRKNHLRCLRVFERLRAEGAEHRWVVAGRRGWLSQRFYDALARSPARHAVILDEDVPEERIANVVKHADLMLYPSLYEGFGLPPLEAQALGVPTVTSAFSSMSEVCGDSAAYCDPEDEKSIYDAVRSVLDDAALRARLIEDGLENAKRFTWERTARATLAAYRRALGVAALPASSASPRL